MTRITYALSIVSLFLTLTFNAHAQSLPSDLRPISPEQMPLDACGGIYSMAHYPDWPPMPGLFGVSTGEQLYFSPSLNSAFYDDRAAVMAQMLTAEESGPPSPGDVGTDTNAVPPTISYSPLYDLSTNFVSLFLEMASASASPTDEANLILHNTSPLTPYLLVTTDNLTNTVLDSWTPEQVVIGAEGTNTPASVFIKDRTNQLFFSARPLPGSNYAAVVMLASTPTSPSAFLNWSSVTPPVFCNTFLGFVAPIYSLNLGLDNTDWSGVQWNPNWTDSYPNSDASISPYNDAYFIPYGQNAIAVAFAPDTLTTMTDLFLSHNPITSLDLHSAWGYRTLNATIVSSCST